MIKADMKATGLKTVKAQLERLRKDGNHTSKQIRTQLGKELVKELRKKAPKDTGEYSKSIQIKTNRKTRTTIGPPASATSNYMATSPKARDRTP